MWKYCIEKVLWVTLIVGLFLLPGVLSAQGNSDWAFERVQEVQEAHTEALMARPGVVGTAVGPGQDGQLTVVVLVERSGVAGIPESLEGVPVQEMVTGRIVALTDPATRFARPVPIGVSVGHPQITAGTIGCRVTDGTDVYALSNNHVFANANQATLGDTILQPGPYDGGQNPADAIGTLFDFELISFSRKAKNQIDAAIALSSVDELGQGTPTDDGYGVPNHVTVAASIGQSVQKYGRTTGLTHGQVTGLNATVSVSYGAGKTAKFVNQILIGPGGFSDGGDSGSLIVTDDGSLNPVGLLFAGSSTVTIANPIDVVLARFGVAIDGEIPVANDAPEVSITDPADTSTHPSGASIQFIAAATDTEDGDLSAGLVWTSDKDGQIGTGSGFSATLSDNIHTITASVTDSGNKTGVAVIVITVGNPPSGPASVAVASITYADSGRTGRDLLITVALEDNEGTPVDGTISITISRDGSPLASGTSTTGADGSVTFKLRNAASGRYTTDVTDVTAPGLTWDGVTPPNQYDK